VVVPSDIPGGVMVPVAVPDQFPATSRMGPLCLTKVPAYPRTCQPSIAQEFPRAIQLKLIVSVIGDTAVLTAITAGQSSA